MKYTDDWQPTMRNPHVEVPIVELTRRNLEVLLAKLDDPASARTLIDPDDLIAIRAVENDEHYKAENRVPGPVYMPTTGMTL